MKKVIGLCLVVLLSSTSVFARGTGVWTSVRWIRPRVARR